MGAVGAMIVMPMTGGSAIAALLAAGVVGAFSGLMGELTQRIFYSHSGTHVDPPAMAIVIVMLIVGVLYLVGVVPNPGYLGL
jgi:formate hydrogenlyase subunit 3/multisubunit Na+/H+ antiporter MnhD subunit